MIFPFPTATIAEECARDIASDCRRLAKNLMPLKEIITRTDATESERITYDMGVAQLRAMSEIICFDVETKAEFCVGDYVTVRRELLANLKKKNLRKIYDNLRRYLH